MADVAYQFIYETPTKILVVGATSSNFGEALSESEAAVAGQDEGQGTGNLLGYAANGEYKAVERLDV